MSSPVTSSLWLEQIMLVGEMEKEIQKDGGTDENLAKAFGGDP